MLLRGNKCAAINKWMYVFIINAEEEHELKHSDADLQRVEMFAPTCDWWHEHYSAALTDTKILMHAADGG